MYYCFSKQDVLHARAHEIHKEEPVHSKFTSSQQYTGALTHAQAQAQAQANDIQKNNKCNLRIHVLVGVIVGVT